MSRRIQHGDWALEWLQYPSYEPLTLSQAKQQLGITDDQTDFDALIGGTGAGDGYISVARSYIEETYGLPILKQRVRLTLGAVPLGRYDSHPDLAGAKRGCFYLCHLRQH